MTEQEFIKLVRPAVLANKSYNKLFCIGANKTGTTTLNKVLKLYGLNIAPQHEQEIRSTKQAILGNYQPLSEFVSKYDAFQDLPFSLGEYFIVVDALFPESKFILSEREPEVWFNSLKKFHEKIFRVDDISEVSPEDLMSKYVYLYEGYQHFTKGEMLKVVEDGKVKIDWDLMYNKDFYMEEYQLRNERVKKYFSHRPSDLLVIDVTKHTNTMEICKFLDIPEKYSIEMPHLNAT